MKKKLNHSIAKVIALTIFMLLTTINVAFAQTKSDKIDKLMSQYSEYGQFNGSVLVAEKGKVIYKKGFGMANMEWNIPNQTQSTD